jgi:hypothetical protein
MHIDDDHRHYGSALIQIAEDKHCTSIKALRYRGRILRCAFRINKDIGVYLRYRSKPKGLSTPYYSFSFSKDNLSELKRMQKWLGNVFLALVCVRDRAICCLPYVLFEELISARRNEKGKAEEEYVIEVNVPEGKSFRVWISQPNTKGHYLKEYVISRKNFPRELFFK